MQQMRCAFHPTNAAGVNCNCCARPLCPACDHRVRGFPFCQECIVAGVDMLRRRQEQLNHAPAVNRRSSPRAALLLSFIAPGLGAAYNGQTSKALVHFGIFACFFQLAVITDGNVFFVLGVLASWLFAGVDAFRTAQLIRSGLAPRAELDLIARRLHGNPLAWGTTLVLLGTIFLLHTIFGINVPMRPLVGTGVVLLGAYMLYDFLRTRRTDKRIAREARSAPAVPDFARGISSTNEMRANLFGVAPVFDSDDIATQIADRRRP